MTEPISYLLVRAVLPQDFENGLGDVLRGLSPDSPDEGLERGFVARKASSGSVTWVAVANDGLIVGTVSVFVEQKMTHDGGLVAHLEDMAVRPEFQGYGIARMLAEHVKAFARKSGCYKVVLSCSEEKRGLYEKCGFRQNEISMRFDL